MYSNLKGHQLDCKANLLDELMKEDRREILSEKYTNRIKSQVYIFPSLYKLWWHF